MRGRRGLILFTLLLAAGAGVYWWYFFSTEPRSTTSTTHPTPAPMPSPAAPPALSPPTPGPISNPTPTPTPSPSPVSKPVPAATPRAANPSPEPSPSVRPAEADNSSAKLTPVAQVGGAVLGVRHMGDKWVAAWGNRVVVYSPSFEVLADVELKFPIVQFFAVVDSQGKGAVYAQSPSREWTVVQHDPIVGYRQSRLPMMGKSIRKALPFVLQGQPYLFALLERNLELWNLSDPRHPRIKQSRLLPLKDPQHLAFAGRHIFVADENSIATIDFFTGSPAASIPAKGVLTSLAVYSLDGKDFLLATAGRDRASGAPGNFGLKLFEIGSDGATGQESQIPVPGDLPVTGARVIPGAGLVLLSVEEAAGLGLKLFDLKTRRFIPIQFASPTGFLQLGEVESGKLSGEPVAVVADGNRLRVFAFKPQGNPPQQFRAEARLTLPGVMSAAWVEADGDGSRLWVGDEGGPGGGGLTRLDGKDMKVLQADGTPGLFPVAGDFKAGGPEGIALYLSVDTAALPMESKLGAIGLTGGGDPEVATVARSGPVLGLKAPQGELRPLGIAAVVYHGRLQIGVALSRVKGALGGSGLGLWYKPVGQGAGQFLAGDLGKAMELIPFQDARDVVFTADGKGAFLAGGVAGVVGMDVEQKKPVSRMSLGTQDWLADRVLLSHGGKIVLASFLHKASGQVIVKIFGVGEGLQMEELGTITGLKAVATAAGLRAPHVAVTGDDRYVLVPVQSDLLTVMDLSQPSQPLEVTSLKVPAEIHGISVAGESPADGSLEIYLALGPAGVAKYKFSPKRP